MSNSVLIIGQSGTGKSTSIRTLDPKSTFVISVIDKALPFKGGRTQYTHIKGWNDKENNLMITDDWQKIVKCIAVVNARPDIKTLVIDDAQYILANEFMRRSGERGFDKYSEMGKHYWDIVNALMGCRDDLISFVLSHSEIDAHGRSKVKTIGKLLDEKITIEGMFTTVLHTQAGDDGYYFLTQTDGTCVAKSPIGMFDETRIENDLQLVNSKIREYFEIQ